MSSICIYFQVHQPFRLRRYTVFDIGQDHHYEDADMNCDILLRVAQKAYLPMNDLLLQLIRRHKGKFRLSFSISGVCLEQFEQHAPEIIDSFRALADTGCVEFLGESYYHSLAFLYSPEEFRTQVEMHARRINELFGQQPRVFRNSELIYNNDLARFVENMGYTAVLAEGADHVLGWRSSNFAYWPAPCKRMKLLLKNYSLSDDVSLRFSDANWSEYPLTAQKYAQWIHESADADVINLFMDYATFGERHQEGSGIFDFMRAFPDHVFEQPGIKFSTLSEAAEQLVPIARLDVPQFMSWADAERDLTAWKGNDMQEDALESLYRLESSVKTIASEDLLLVWRKLQTSDHFYYMCTKWFADGGTHRYFNPYDNPYDAYINFMNVLGDFELSLKRSAVPAHAQAAVAKTADDRTESAKKAKAAAAPEEKPTAKREKMEKNSVSAKTKTIKNAPGMENESGKAGKTPAGKTGSAKKASTASPTKSKK